MISQWARIDQKYEEGKFMAWVYLIAAGVFEIGWPYGLKMAQSVEGKQLSGFLSL